MPRKYNISTSRITKDMKKIMLKAEEEIRLKTGMQVTLNATYSYDDNYEFIRKLFVAMAHELGRPLNWILESREGERPTIRYAMLVVAKKRYPNLPLSFLAKIMGKKSHISVMRALTKGRDLLRVEDSLMKAYYEKIKHWENK